MVEVISKTRFKAHAQDILKDIEHSGQSRIITDRGKPTLEVRKLRQQKAEPLSILKGTVIKYVSPTTPVSEDDWESGWTKSRK
jgi:hypothetical protein